MFGKSFKAFPICDLKTFDSIAKDNNCLVLLRVNLIQERYFVLGKGYSQQAYLPLGIKTKDILARITAFKNTVYTAKSVIVTV